LPSWIRIWIPDPQTRLNTDPIRIQIRIHNPGSKKAKISLRKGKMYKFSYEGWRVYPVEKKKQCCGSGMIFSDPDPTS
jgi:hypothetical protein